MSTGNEINDLTIGQTPNPESKEETAAWFGLFTPNSKVKVGRMVKGALNVKGDGALAIGNLTKSTLHGEYDTIYAEKGAWIIIDKAIKVVKSGIL